MKILNKLVYLSRLLFFLFLMIPAVRVWCYKSGLRWLYILSFAFSVSYLIVPLVRCVAVKMSILDHPSERKIHLHPTPLMGGIAVYVGFALALIYNFEFSLGLKGAALGATLVMGISIMEDIWGVPAFVRLIAQIAGAGILLKYKIVLNVIPNTIPYYDILNGILTVIWVIGITNAIQVLDGMDGLTAGLGVIIAFFFSIVALQTNQGYLMFLAAALLGSCLGFLPYNFRPGRSASIFLGDGGSSFIGFSIASYAILGEWAKDNPLVAFSTPLLILSVPIFDMTYVMISRLFSGKINSFKELLGYVAKDHIHHRFEALGLTKTQTVLTIHFLSISLGLSALLISRSTLIEAIILITQACFILLIVTILEIAGRRENNE